MNGWSVFVADDIRPFAGGFFINAFFQLAVLGESLFLDVFLFQARRRSADVGRPNDLLDTTVTARAAFQRLRIQFLQFFKPDAA